MAHLGDDTLVRAQGIRKSFGGHDVLRDVSFSLRLGNVVVLRGENGSGKTTLLNILTGNLPPDGGRLDLRVGLSNESFQWPTHWLERINPFSHFTPERVCRAGVSRVWQDIRLFGSLSVVDNVTLASDNPSGENPLLALVRRGDAIHRDRRHRQAATDRLVSLGMERKLGASCDRLSLGQMKRVAIARAVQSGARVLMLDEPLAGLDGDGQREVLRYVRDVATAGEHALIIVEHLFNLPKVLELATHVWTLRGGAVQVEAPEEVCKELEAEDLGAGAMFDRLRRLTAGGGVSVQARRLVVRRGFRRVLEGLDFAAEPGVVVPLAYPNGWGKSTLLDALAGVIPVEGGSVWLGGRDVTRLPASERVRMGLGYLRSTDNVVPGLTVREHLALSGGVPTLGSRFEAWRALLAPEGKEAGLLSGGERQKLAIACLPLGPALLLDEPFLNLDASSIRLFCEILDELRSTRITAFPTPESLSGPSS